MDSRGSRAIESAVSRQNRREDRRDPGACSRGSRADSSGGRSPLKWPATKRMNLAIQHVTDPPCARSASGRPAGHAKRTE